MLSRVNPLLQTRNPSFVFPDPSLHTYLECHHVTNVKVIKKIANFSASSRTVICLFFTYFFVSYVFQCVRNHRDSHIDQIRGGHFKHLFRKFFAILVNFLKRKKIMVVDKLPWKSEIPFDTHNTEKFEKKVQIWGSCTLCDLLTHND